MAKHQVFAFMLAVVVAACCAVLCGCGTDTRVIPRQCFPPRDDFGLGVLNTDCWDVVKGAPEIENGWLVLCSNPGAIRGEEIQSKESVLYGYLQFRADASEWCGDTSAGFELWTGADDPDPDRHYGILVTNGCLAVINRHKDDPPGEGEVYLPIGFWPRIEDQANLFSITWSDTQVELSVNAAHAQTYEGPSLPEEPAIPDRPLEVRFNANDDTEYDLDCLRVDWVAFADQP